MRTFKKGDRIIWNSHFGYDIGYFIGEGVMYYTYSVEIVTGKYPGEMSLPVNEIHPYSDGLVDDLTKEYGYERRFSEVF